jgi:RNA polymerase sigma factor (sigma-70 family)
MRPDVEKEIGAWIEAWRGPLVGLLLAWGAGRSEAAEVAQDTLVEAWLGRARLRGDLDDSAAAGPWLQGIARNLLRSRRRAAGRRREEELAHEPAQSARVEDERLEVLRRELARLPEELRTVVYLFYLERTSVLQVAGLLGLPPTTVESRLQQARRALRERVAAARETT